MKAMYYSIGLTQGLATAWTLKFLFGWSDWIAHNIAWSCVGLFIVHLILIGILVAINSEKLWPQEKK